MIVSALSLSIASHFIIGKKSKLVFDFFIYSWKVWFSFSYIEVDAFDQAVCFTIDVLRFFMILKKINKGVYHWMLKHENERQHVNELNCLSVRMILSISGNFFAHVAVFFYFKLNQWKKLVDAYFRMQMQKKTIWPYSLIK